MIDLSGIDSFEKSVKADLGVCVVEFWGPQCIPCLQQKETLEKIATDFPQVKFFAINIEDEIDLAVHLSVRGLPVLTVFRQGSEVKRWNGLVSEGQIVSELQKNIEG